MGLLSRSEEYLKKERNLLAATRLVPSLYRRSEEVLKRDKLLAEFNAQKNKEKSYFIMTDDAFANAKEFEKIHIDLYREQNKQPSMLSLAKFHVDRLGLNDEMFKFNCLWLLSKRAEETNFNAPSYHNISHFKDVLAVSANFLERNQSAARNEEVGFVKLTKHDMFLTMIAAIGHDLNHKGYSNHSNNKVFNEEESFRVMLPYLKASNMSENDIEKVHTILIATSPNGGNQYVKALAQAKREGRAVTHKELDPEGNFPQLKPLIYSKRLLQMAAIVADADLYASSGAGFKSHMAMNSALTKESEQTGVKMNFNTAASSNFFFSKIVGEDGYASEVARKIANPSFKKMFSEVKEILAN